MGIYYARILGRRGGAAMDTYKAMYYELFKAITKSIELLKEAQVKVEEMYLSADETN
jgi:hypothetical protein